MTTEMQYLPRGVDHVGFIEAQLRNLQGFSTLAYELIQNADDAPGADTIIFDVREDALVVDNNGVFSDCGAVGKRTCLWKEHPEKKHYCDFHRFQYVASGDKRLEEYTTGAFGIGFVAVYQITDHPELISNSWHWILHEENTEDKRIVVCSGCKQCQQSNLPGTRFILRWATNPNSRIRQDLRAEAMTSERQRDLLSEIQACLPVAMIFLKKIKLAEIRIHGKLHQRFERIPRQGGVIIRDSHDTNSGVYWTILEGDFQEESEELRRQNPGRIEEKRSPKVQIAVPVKPIAKGFLCACLPTEQETGLPFHINADFFPSSDRKKVILADDYQSRWNRAAIKGASEILANSFDSLPGLCGHKYLWEIIVAIYNVSQAANRGNYDKAFLDFWSNLYPVLRKSPVMFTENNQWVLPSGAFLLWSPDDEEAQPVFDMLGLAIIHHGIRSYVFSVRYAEDLGVRRLELENLVEALRNKGFTERIDREILPPLLQKKSGLFLLYDEILRLLKNRQLAKEKRFALEKNLKECSLFLCRDQALCPVRELFRADEKTMSLFDSLGHPLPFAEALDKGFEEIENLIPLFTCNDAIQHLKAIAAGPKPSEIPRVISPRLLAWFEQRKDELNSSPQLKTALANLPIFPGSNGLHPLPELALPGDFDDPIGFSDFIDLTLLGGRRDFLRELGAKPLTLVVYVRNHLPRAFKVGVLSPEKKRQVVKLLALELSKIKEEHHIFDTLRSLSIIECTDQEFREPQFVYFPGEDVKKILGDTMNFALLPDENRLAIAEFYEWLDVARRPRSHDIIKRISQLTADKPHTEGIQSISNICRYLGRHYEDTKESDSTVEDLKTRRWLPAKGYRDRWRLPLELFTVFQDYLFTSQAQFLDIPLQIQQAAAGFFTLIGVKSTPNPDLVARHLLHCSEKGIDVNPEVYSYLMDKANDQVISLLKGRATLNLGGGRYVCPDKVFWSVHPFGQFRYTLSSEMRKYHNFLTKLGVREAPENRDALDVLQEISEQYGSTNSALDENAKTVYFACWKMLTEELSHDGILPETIRKFAANKRLILDDRNILNPPEHIFFEDRSGVSIKFGEFLRHNTIPRMQGAWPAMAAAGVRPLSDVIHVQLLEAADSVPDETMERRIIERRRQLERVIEPHKEIATNQKFLESVACMRANDLIIQYELNAFNTRRPSDPEAVPAYCDRDKTLLYFVKKNGIIPWTSMARELALAVAPDADPGLLASGLKDALSADTEEEAQRILDELGYAPLATIEGILAVGETIMGLGGEPVPPDRKGQGLGDEKGADQDTATGAIGEVMKTGGEGWDKQSVSGKVPLLSGEETDSSGTKPSSEDALRGIFGPVGVPTPEAEKSADDGVEKDSGKEEGAAKKPRRRKNILRSIVYPEESSSEEKAESDTIGPRNEVDEAGVQHVVEYEKSRGRHPEVMPHYHPGYDIEAKDKWGDVVRYIEVKSLTDRWAIGNAVLSKTQFEKAAELGQRYWLYVVEKAQEDDFCLYCIQNPANRVDQFVFDDRWMALSID